MRILHTADWHLGKKLDTFSRHPEQEQVLHEICEIADRENSDVIIVAGDLFDGFNPPSESQQLLYSTLKRLTAHGTRPVIAIAGNHDSPDRIMAADPLAISLGIFFAGYPDSSFIPQTLDSGIEITHSEPGFLELKLPAYTYPVRLLLTPYASEMRLRQRLHDDGSGQAMRDLLKTRWADLADKYCDNMGVNILAAHLYVMQEGEPMPEEPDDEKPILIMGNAQAVFTNNFPPQMQYVALGHLHRRQKIGGTGFPVVYSSSPLAYSFSEADQDKFVVMIDVEPGKEAVLNNIKLGTGRRLLRFRSAGENPVEDALKWLSENREAYTELTIVSGTALSGAEHRSLRSAHERIVCIIPEVTGAGPTGEQARSFADLSQNMDTLFTQFYRESNGGQEPSANLTGLFREMLSLDNE